MRMLTRATLAALLMLGLLGGAALAEEHEYPPHPHMLLLHVEIDPDFGDHGGIVDFKRCVDVAAGNALPLNAHHAHFHTGTAGAALRGAGHFVVPGAPLTPLENCAELEAVMGFLGGLPFPPPPED